MIPIKLQIKNFISYGPKTQTVNFGSYNLICLSGKNGHGKSALLDAITWAVWGQARKVNGILKADFGLMHLGETNMMVCIDFECNSIKYRIRREYTVTGNKSHLNLEFGIIDNSSGLFKPLTDKTIRATQSKIESIIGLNYESFSNSAFLRQGQSNEFSKKSPKDRKEVLASILGLDQFEKLRKLAAEKSKDANTKKSFTEQLHTQIKKELEQKKGIILELKEVNKQFDEIHVHEISYKNELNIIKKNQKDLNIIKSKTQQLIFETDQLNLLIKNETTEFLENFNKWRSIFKKRKSSFNFKELNKKHDSLNQKLKEVQLSFSKQIALKEKLMSKKEEKSKYLEQFNKKFDQEKEEIKFQIQKINFSIQNFEQKIKELNLNYKRLEQEKSSLNNQLSSLKINHKIEELTDQISKEEKDIDKQKVYYQKYTNQINLFETELANISQKKSIIKDSISAKCPLCEQDLANNSQENLSKKFLKQEQFINHQKRRLDKVIIDLNSNIISHNNSINKLKKLLEDTKIILIKQQDTQKHIEKTDQNISLLTNEIKNSESSLTKNQKILLDLKTSYNNLEINYNKAILDDKNYNLLKSEVKQIETELNSISYDPEKESKLYQEIKQIEIVKDEQSNLLQDISLQENRKEKVSKLCQEIKKLKATKKEKEQEILKYSSQKNQELYLQNRELEITNNMQVILNKKEKLIHQKGALEQKKLTLEQKTEEFNEQASIISKLDLEVYDYKTIATALSKDGIQALLIENAIPEIEHEANLLLNKLTDNQSHLIIDSVRDLKSGGTKETLDIKISDSVGIRPYELFSGGEAFRIDFALRIAISKLLARKAGASLQTLIIDEGFGSQDEEGLSNIMSALYKIQEDFAKVIIVSHLNSMKDQFPVNFLVHKSPQGSLIKVLEQG